MSATSLFLQSGIDAIVCIAYIKQAYSFLLRWRTGSHYPQKSATSLFLQSGIDAFSNICTFVFNAGLSAPARHLAKTNMLCDSRQRDGYLYRGSFSRLKKAAELSTAGLTVLRWLYRWEAISSGSEGQRIRQSRNSGPQFSAGFPGNGVVVDLRIGFRPGPQVMLSSKR